MRDSFTAQMRTWEPVYGVHVLVACLCHWAPALAGPQPPTDNPIAHYELDWMNRLPWSHVVNIDDVAGASIDVRFSKAQQAIAEQGGGVVYFPAGAYRFADSVYLRDAVVIRGAEARTTKDARNSAYHPETRFEFPKYRPTFEGEGTPIGAAFKGIQLKDPTQAGNCGVVNISINRGHIHFQEGPDHECGRNRLVYGCVLRNAAVANRRVPDAGSGQHRWQRFTHRHHAAIAVKASENVLVANNRLPKSGDDNFPMKAYLLKGRPFDVVFDYDNRPGLYINDYGLGGTGGQGPDGTPRTHPWGFRKGIVIRDNYVYCTGRCAISFPGDGTICADNMVRFADDVYRPTTTGTNITAGSATNDNRAVQMRGWRWTVRDNDCRVYRNWAADRKYRINDGEGLMHEDHVNCTVLDSKLMGNKGNAYISICKTAGINGLLIKGNDVRTSGGIAAICVVANRNSGPYECRNVTIEGNSIAGTPAEGNVIRNNRHTGPDGKIINDAHAICENNAGYTVVAE